MFPSIEATEVGATGLFWLFLSYGYILYYASSLISEGSDLLLLIPSMAGLVGGVVLPLLGAVPDGAIMLFSGLGDIETAQETLSVGVGALAGSTIMLLTVPWSLSIFGGRVDLDENGKPNYLGKPKLTPNLSVKDELNKTGVSISDVVSRGGIIVMITTIPYFLIQIPALFLHGPSEEVAAGEKWWALTALIVCVTGFVTYLYLQWRQSQKGMDRMKRVAVMKKLMQAGAVSLSGALGADIKKDRMKRQDGGGYQTIPEEGPYPPPEVSDFLKEVLHEAFGRYDVDGNGTLEKKELKVLFGDFHESIDDETVDSLFVKFDTDGDGIISFDEFIGACYVMISEKLEAEESAAAVPETPSVPEQETGARGGSAEDQIVKSMFADEEEQEEVPEEFTELSPDEQQNAIKKRAFTMLSFGTLLVILFSDPMVDVMQEIANRIGLPPFYVAFILAPLAANASEVMASQYYAAKKTRKTISVSLTALEGAASMNNTFCLSIFMALIFFRGLAWQYTAETIAILVVEYIVGFMVQKSVMTTKQGAIILAIFPLSIMFVAVLEAFGLD